MTIQIRSLSHRRRILTPQWTVAKATENGYLPAHWHRADLGLWQDAGVTPAAAANDPVGRWEDQTANADHVNQTTAGYKPTLQTGILNGQPIVRYDGTDDRLLGAFTTGGALTQPFMVFAVARLDASCVEDDSAHMITDGDDVTNYAYLRKAAAFGAPPDDCWNIKAGSDLGGDLADSDWHIFAALFNGASSILRLDGVLSGGPGNAGANIMDGLSIGSRSSGGFPWYGDIAEVIIYNADLPDADENQVGRYLATRYALTYTDI